MIRRKTFHKHEINEVKFGRIQEITIVQLLLENVWAAQRYPDLGNI